MTRFAATQLGIGAFVLVTWAFVLVAPTRGQVPTEGQVQAESQTPAGPSAAKTQSPHGELDMKCSACHSQQSWYVPPDVSGFRHEDTGYPLVAMHASVECRSCHGDLEFSKVDNECRSCHEDEHRGEFGNRCETCHSPNAWQDFGPAVELHASTGFPLVGSHTSADCVSCHTESEANSFEGTPTECSGCHLEDYVEATSPDHALAHFSEDCTQCHSVSGLDWTPADYEHPQSFPLIRPHDGLSCNECHAETYTDQSSECVTCHQSDADAAEPSHAGFPSDCLSCHQDTQWEGADFEHPRSFPLTQGHGGVACASCHSTEYEGTPTECIECHLSDAQGADPNHDGFGSDCLTCHSLSAWEPADFEHPSSFPLSDGHAGVDCASCHASGYEGTSTECMACHEADFGAAEPDHDGGGFPEDCLSCHTMVAWEPAEFEHPQSFPLTGGHEAVECASCHGSGYEDTPTDCIECHLADFRTADPDHVNGGFPEDCTTCHSVVAWEPADFEHPASFPLSDGHSGVSCSSCHLSGYEGTPTECMECHRADWQSALPNHSEFPTDCLTCHSLVSWSPAQFDHPSSFPLTDGHADVDCASCHPAGYEGTPTDCIECHGSDFQQAVPDHDGSGFPEDCLRCHNMVAWQPASFDHTETFPLTLGHSGLLCASCHTDGFEDTPTQCVECHLSDFQGAEPSHDGFNDDCTTCHSMAAWRPADFEHPSSFPLTDGHFDVDCASCHAAGYTDTPNDCYECHQRDFESATPIHDGFPQECTTCHSTAAWQPSSFDHPTSFPLADGHSGVDCASCHQGGYEGTPTDCVDCHLADYDSAEPSHDGFPQDCTRCHNVVAWQPAGFDHTDSFPLTDGHANVSCASCHQGGTYEGTPTECLDCHFEDFHTASPSHDGFSADCTTCHSMVAWNPAEFEHPSTFPLTEGHAEVECASCHAAGYAGTPTDCIECHLADFDGADPSHDGFPTDCTSCHSLTAWEPADFNHTDSFPLTNGHSGLECASCHSGGYEETPTDCVECHLSDFNGADPNHDGFPTDCASCHTLVSWDPSTFEHPPSFPLTGGHGNVDCASCHADGYDDTPTDCIECHLDDFNGAEPSHADFPTDCLTCHSLTAWEPADFDHPESFPLRGGHAQVDCASCHADGYEGTPTDCIECHLGDFQNAEPSHADFPTDCLTCHTLMAWQPADFEHDFFPLTGGHDNLACATCHTGGYEGTPSDCVECHLSDYQNAVPDHGEFTTDCTSCHTLTAWEPSTFQHPPSFPLTEGHSGVDCASCHADGYEGTSTVCVDCHLTDFQNAEPSHAEFPTDCLTCHTMTAWQPADFDHGFFPLSGGHQDVPCATCHSSGYEGTPSDCIECHLADYQGAEPDHSDFPTDCTACHTVVAWQPADIDHDFFPLTGGHQDLSCTSCHADGYEGTPTECIDCHLSDFQSASPDHDGQGFPEDCLTCHSLTAWEPADFDHDDWFPIYSGPHREPWDDCSDCHTAPGDFTIFSCLNCHEHSESRMNDKHDEEDGYEYESNACYSCHPRGRE